MSTNKKSNKLPANIKRVENGSIVTYRYYTTDILTINKTTKIATFDTGGYFTSSTRRHMKNMFEREGYNISISFAGDRISIYYNGKSFNYNNHITSFDVDL